MATQFIYTGTLLFFVKLGWDSLCFLNEESANQKTRYYRDN